MAYDYFSELLQYQIQKTVSSSGYLRTVPCKVIALGEKNMVTVATITNNSMYTVKNLSGTNLVEGQEVKLFYSGDIIADGNPFVSMATPNDSGGEPHDSLSYVTGNVLTGIMTGTEKLVTSIAMSTDVISNAFLSVSLNLFGGIGEDYFTENAFIKMFLDELELAYQPIQTVAAGSYSVLNFQLPIALGKGLHKLLVKLQGKNMTLVSGNVYVRGTGIEDASDYDITTENDYVTITDSDGTNVLYYKGTSNKPEIPTTLNGSAVKTISATAFNYSTINSVSIPDGVIEIE